MASLWRELHMRALKYEGTNDTHFITVWSGKIPRYTGFKCRCKEFWEKWRLLNPPTFTKEKYFNWTVDAHNAVNKKLGKSTLTYDEALKIYLPEKVEKEVEKVKEDLDKESKE